VLAHLIAALINRAPGPYANRAYAYASMGQYDRAAIDYDLAIQCSPTITNPLLSRGNCYIRLGKIEEVSYYITPHIFERLRG